MADSTGNRKSPGAGKSDRLVKIGFIIVAVLIGTLVYLYLQTETFMKGWPEDLKTALADAKQTDRKVLVVFISNPPNNEAIRNADIALGKPKNRKAIEQGKFARVKVTVNDLNSDVARQYKLTHLPTMIILGPDGRELNRREGVVGEVPFLHGFIDVTEIQGPGK